MNKEFFISNRRKISEKLQNGSILILFAGQAPYKSADETYKFTPNRNFYYLTGIDEEKVILMLIKNEDKVIEHLFIQESDPIMEKWVGKTINANEANEISGLIDVKYIKDFNDTVGSYLNRISIENLYLDLERQEFKMASTEAQDFAKQVIDKYPYIRVKNIYHEIALLRTVKSTVEVELISKAIEITNKGILSMMKNAKPGMMEYEIEAYFDFELKRNGIKDFAFPTIAAAGVNGTILHYGENNSKTAEGDLLLLDLGAQYKYYNADISRTFPVSGKFTERQKQIYNIVLKANEEVMKAVKPGVTTVDLQKIAKAVLAEGCKAIGLIKEDSEIDRYYYHGVAHPLGLDTHDVGPRGIELQPGMIITDEPGLYIEEEKIGIRIEDDILVTEDGYVNLSKNIIKSVEEIEEYMKN